jgi:4-amino-4-deoxy-L-arabinose transferase-like glycosyltransferase
MPSLRSRSTLSVLFALLAGAALRVWFIRVFPQIQGDSLLYADIARNWLLHGIYGRSVLHPGGPPTIAPTLVRLPGYPGFLALCFAAFGNQNYLAVLYLQAIIDLATCLLIAGFVRRLCGSLTGLIALWLAALCPFTANYVAMPLTETLYIFFVALGL